MIGVDPHKASRTAVAVGAGERVLDVQPKLAARVRLLAAEAAGKNDPNDARSVAVTALRSPAVREVVPDDHCAVLRMWSRRHHDLGRNRTRIACRLHAERHGQGVAVGEVIGDLLRLRAGQANAQFPGQGRLSSSRASSLIEAIRMIARHLS